VRTREASSKTSRTKHRGVSLNKRRGRWKAECRIGGRNTSLGTFGSEEEAARPWERMRLWKCKADGKKEEDVEEQLNFHLAEYSDDEVSELQGLTREAIIQKLRRTGSEERVVSQSSKYTGVRLVKSTGRWKAECRIEDKVTSLGAFDSEEKAARAWDRMRLWSCKADGREKQEVKLNFPLAEYTDAEVTALQGLTREGVIQKVRRAGQEERVASQASKYTGVAPEKSTGRWRAQLCISG
jgi:hypothetical protein